MNLAVGEFLLLIGVVAPAVFGIGFIGGNVLAHKSIDDRKADDAR